MRKLLLGLVAAILLASTASAATTAFLGVTNTLQVDGATMSTAWSISATSNVSDVLYWGPTFQATPSNYPNYLSGTPATGGGPYSATYTVSSIPGGSVLYNAIVYDGGTSGVAITQTSYTMPTATPTSTATPTNTPNWTATITPSVTPTTTPTFVPGSHLVNEQPITETFVPAVPSTYNFTLTYYPSGPISMSILDQTTGHWVFIDSIPRTSSSQLLSVASSSPGLLAYTVLSPKTYQLGIGSRNQVFVTGRTYLIYIAYSTFAP